MYISEIDDILDQTLDKFMYLWIVKNQITDLLSFLKLIKEPNFIKYQKDINKIIEYGQELISDKDINKFVTKNSNIVLIKNVISKYLCYYLFILIGINYKGKMSSFNNNLIELSRTFNNNKVQIENFFNTESNSIIIKTVILINEFFDYINKLIKKNDKNETNDISKIQLNNYSDSLKDFLNLYGEKNINNFIILYKDNSKENNKIIIDHNIVKIMIYLNIYKNSEKKEIFNIIETTEISNGEFIFIDIVVPKSSFFDFNSIQTILEPSELYTNLPETIYNLINEDYSENINDAQKYFTDLDLKIQNLLDTNIIIPIVDDFLLYNKDSEKYEKQGDKHESVKKKDDTKIKYIVNKINTVCNYYKNPEEIKKLFYIPLQNRNAVLVNTYEDIKIISKMKNIIKMNNENIDLLNDLISYKFYPYISFKDFKKNGFVFNSNSTLESIRNISISNLKVNNKKFNTLQTRIISENMLANIVGFVICNSTDDINCINPNTFVDICSETDNPLQVIKILLKNKIMEKNIENQESILKKNYYWLFDLEKQKYFVPNYDISPNMNKNDVVKILSAYLYDWVMECVIDNIKDNVNNSHSKSITEYINKFDIYKYKYPDIINPKYSKNINELEFLMYYIKSKKNTDNYDYKEDEFPGLYGNIYKLPIITKKQSELIPTIKINTDFIISEKPIINKTYLKKELQKDINLDLDLDLDLNSDFNNNEYIYGICQHNISWDKIGELKKKGDSRYSNLIYEFIQQYVDISPTQDFICKSCKSSINIKRYILDGQFDNNTQSFITFSVQLDLPLEDLPEFEKYKTSIRSLDKIIDRISSIINIQGIIGSSYTARTKRKNIIKDTLDILLAHNNYLKKSSYLSNRDKYINLFGINKNISNLYIFELENNIFVYSSKDKDFYKFLKYNNIISYILILLILEINDTQILSLSNDKICSYFIYKKIGYTLFDNINIIINKSHDIKPVQDYPILCYLIYIMSCFISKYNLWADTLSTESNIIDKKKNFLVIQKSIINTIIEIFNSILLVNVDQLKLQKIYLYEIFQTKYYYKIDFFKNFTLIKKLDKMYLADNSKQQIKMIVNSAKFDLEPNNDIYNNFVYDYLYDKFSKKYCLTRLECPLIEKNIIKINKISNLTNCISGEFHNFKSNNKNLMCIKCNEISNPLNLIIDSEKLIKERYIILYLRKLAKKYCKTGNIHQFKYNSKLDQDNCLKCGYVFGDSISYTDSELFKLYNTIEINIKKNNIIVQKIINNSINISNNEVLAISTLFNKIIYKYEKYNNNIHNSIDKLLDSMQKLIGIEIIINNQTYNLFWNIYIINFDYNGAKLETPILVYENENKFRLIENHNYFKRSVLVYTIQKNIKYELFYDFEEKIFLGYRELNKEYINNKNFNIKLKINYSFKNMLTFFGFTGEQINIRDFYPEIFGYSEEKFKKIFSNFNMENFINKIAYRRFNIVKKLGIELKKYINRFKNNYKINIITIETTYGNNLNQQISNTYISDSANNSLDLIYTKYQKKIEKNIITEVYDDNKSKKNNLKNNKNNKNNKDINNDYNSLHIFLKYINTINLYLPFENIKLTKDDFPKFLESINYTVILKNDYITNITLNYIIDEIIRLINYNSNKNIKTNIINFIANLICIIFNNTFFEISKFNKDLSCFYQILYTSEFYLETQTSNFMVDVLDYYSNQEEIKNIDNLDDEKKEKLEEQIENDNQEFEGMDVDGEYDAEGVFDLYTKYDTESINEPNIII